MIHFVGAGPGAPDLITVRGQKLLQEADVIIYAGSLVNPSLLDVKKGSCRVYNSAHMTLEEVLQVMRTAEKEGRMTVRLHTGDPCLYGTIREQMDALREEGIDFDICPGVSAFCGAASALELEYTLPGVSQTVIISRTAGRTPVPEKESIRNLAVHQATMVLFLSAGHLLKLQGELLAGGYPADTPAAICYKATWPEEKKLYCTVGTLAETAKKEDISNTALIIVGEVIGSRYDRSFLYDPAFTTAFRQGSSQNEEKKEPEDESL